MFSREKLQQILKDNQGVNNVSNYFKVVLNKTIEENNVINKKLNMDDDDCGDEDEQSKSYDKKIYSVEDTEDVEIFTINRYNSDNRVVLRRNSRILRENIFRCEHNLSGNKLNKKSSAAESENNVDVLFLGQCFALMPVKGILNSNPEKLRFSYKSFQVFLTTFFMCSSSILTLTMLKFLIKVGINAKNFVGLVFFSCVQCSTFLFASLAQRWPKIMRYWSKVESIFTQKPYEIPKRVLAERVRVSAVFIILGSAVEHALYLISAVLTYRRRIELCASVRNYTEEISFQDYVHRNYNYVFEILPYNMFMGIFILIINGSCTFVWNYMDLFIMMVSKAIAYRFEQITKRINQLIGKEVPETIFIEIREHYVKLCELLEFIDENLSGIILLSCINNLYFVCYQLLNIFNKLRWPINYIYFWYSLLYLIGRMAFVFLSAASINDQSKAGLPVLRKVSPRTWCVEVERLIFEMTTQTVALSGKKFYFLTRRLLFGMAGTIVTYELVLLQFDEPNRSKGLTALCD
ncbi:gustatory receptor 64a isoform 2-T3 [Cochliomyia hominivorax]